MDGWKGGWMYGKNGWKEWMDVMCMVRPKIRRRVKDGGSGGCGFGKDEELPKVSRTFELKPLAKGSEEEEEALFSARLNTLNRRQSCRQLYYSLLRMHVDYYA